MFEVRCLVADKRLPEVLRALNKLTLEPPVIVSRDEPALNGASPKMIATPHGGESVRQVVEGYIRHKIKHGAKFITATDLREFVVEKGFSDRAYSYPLSVLVKEKLLKTGKTQGTYEVV